MAVTPGGTGGGQGGPSLPSNLTPSILAQTNALKTNAEVLAQNQSLLGNVSLAEDEAAQKTAKFSEALKKQVSETAQALSATNQLSGALGNYMGTLTKAASLNQHYSRMLKEVDDAQKLYLGSLNFSAKGIDNASHKLQNHITVMNRMKIESRKLADEFNMSAEETDKYYNEMMGRFGRQIMASTNAMGELKEASKAALMVARTSGIDAGKAGEFMSQRFHGSRKTTTELTKDMKTLAVTVNSYKESLKTLSKDAMNQSLLQADEFVQVLGELSKAFEHGPANIKLFGDVLGGFSKALAQAGVNTNIVKRDMAAAVKYFGDLNRPDLKNFVGTTVAMRVSQSGGEGVIVDPKIKARLQKEMERATSRGRSELTKAQMAGEIAQEDVGYQRALAQKEVEIKPQEIRVREMIDQYGMSARAADRFVELQEKIANKTDEELKQGDAEIKEYQELVKETKKGSTPKDKMYKDVLTLRTIMQKIERFISQNLWVSIGVAAAASIYRANQLNKINQSILGLKGTVGGDGGPGGPASAPGAKKPVARTGSRWSRARGAISRTVGRARGAIARNPGKTMIAGAGLTYLGTRALGRDLSEGESAAVTTGGMGLTAASTTWANRAAAAAKAPAPIPWQARQATQIKDALELQKKIQQTNATIMASYAKAPAKAPGLLSRTKSFLKPAAKVAGKVTGAAGKVLGVAGKAMGPIGVAAGALLAVPDLINRWKKADTIGGKAKAVGHFALEATGAKFAYKTGLQLGDFLDKKTRFITDSVNKKLGTSIGRLAALTQKKTERISDILDDVATLPEELADMARKAMEGTKEEEKIGLLKRAERIKADIKIEEKLGLLSTDWAKKKEEYIKKGGQESQDAVADSWKDAVAAFKNEESVSDVLDNITSGMKDSRESGMTTAAMAGRADQKLIIEQGEGGGEADSEWTSDPISGGVKFKTGTWVTIRKDALENTVSGIVAGVLSKGT